MTVTYQKELLSNILHEIKPIFSQAHEEVEWEHEKLPLDPNYEAYFAMEQKGILHIITARADEKLIGYYISLVCPNHHSQGVLFAQNDLLYILPEYRKGMIAYKMFKYAETCLKEIGVKVILFNMKVTHPFEAMAKRLGYTNIEKVYGKFLED